ncbi:type I methionyl aminopeptidase [Candidatus Uhrbacteria bacterium]|nr:type I methionyl aminopeptidase [Candidatus Uhrbacteria bacterium]
MVTIKTPEEITLMREGGRILATVLGEVVALVKPGVSTAVLEEHAVRRLKELGAVSSFIGYRGKGNVPFPSSLCTSINEEIVHAPAIPGRVLTSDDIIGLDFGCRYPASSKGFYTDMAVTVGVGNVPEAARRLMTVTRRSLQQGLKMVRPGNYIHDVSRAIQKFIHRYGFGIVREFVGHGVGYAIHEDPQIFNYYEAGQPRVEMKEGMCLAIEPMVTLGDHAVKVLPDGWTAVTKDGSLAAHFELTVVVTKSGYEILTRTN